MPSLGMQARDSLNIALLVFNSLLNLLQPSPSCRPVTPRPRLGCVNSKQTGVNVWECERLELLLHDSLWRLLVLGTVEAIFPEHTRIDRQQSTGASSRSGGT